MTFGTNSMRNNMADYSQGDIVWADYPLSDKPEKSKIRPVLIVSNIVSNRLDNDFLIAPITSKIRSQPFEVVLTDDKVDEPLPALSVVRCNKLHTIRNSRITGRITNVKSEILSEIIVEIGLAVRVTEGALT